MMRIKSIKLFSVALCSGLILTGCQTVNVKKQSLTMTISNERDSILTRNTLSEASLNVLSMTGRNIKSCTERPEPCVGELKSIPEVLDEQLFSTASELFLAKSLALENSSACRGSLLKSAKTEVQQRLDRQYQQQCLDQSLHLLDRSIRYSYAYLFKTQRPLQERIFDNRMVQVRDFYNTALTKLLTSYMQRHDLKVLPDTLHLAESRYRIDLSLHSSLKKSKIEELTSSYNLNFSGFRSINRRDGFGSEFVAILAPANTQIQDTELPRYLVDPERFYAKGPPPNIQTTRYLSATVVSEPTRVQSIDDILYRSDMVLKVYDPLRQHTINIQQKSYSLAANFTAPYGLWLAENNLGKSAYLTLFDRDPRLTMPQLYLQEPYDPNKKVVVLIHGLASSPEAWIRLTNDIMGDPTLRERYQIWQVFYSTNTPIFESRFQIYHLLKKAFADAEKQGRVEDAVLIGHSMGGLIARFLLNDVDVAQHSETLKDNSHIKRLKRSRLVAERLKIRNLPQFERVVFLASPHRGTEYADRWFTVAARKVIKLPSTFISALNDIAPISELDVGDLSMLIKHGLIQNGPSDLSNKSRFIELTKDIQLRQGLKFHSIIGNNADTTDKGQITDGIVPYSSAHLEGAVSEKIIRGGHSIQETPEAVLELRRILKLHLDESPSKKLRKQRR